MKWNGETYTESDTYTFMFTNAAGCDSVATLNLTINNSSSSTQDVSECYSYQWNGITYSESGVYTFDTTNAVGCDSTATLNLTILDSRPQQMRQKLVTAMIGMALHMIKWNLYFQYD